MTTPAYAALSAVARVGPPDAGSRRLSRHEGERRPQAREVRAGVGRRHDLHRLDEPLAGAWQREGDAPVAVGARDERLARIEARQRRHLDAGHGLTLPQQPHRQRAAGRQPGRVHQRHQLERQAGKAVEPGAAAAVHDEQRLDRAREAVAQQRLPLPVGGELRADALLLGIAGHLVGRQLRHRAAALVGDHQRPRLGRLRDPGRVDAVHARHPLLAVAAERREPHQQPLVARHRIAEEVVAHPEPQGHPLQRLGPVGGRLDPEVVRGHGTGQPQRRRQRAKRWATGSRASSSHYAAGRSADEPRRSAPRPSKLSIGLLR